jgi:hypothetical protein
MMTTLKSISLCLLSLTLCSSSSFASAFVRDNEESIKQKERREKSFKVKVKSRKKASLLQDIREADAARHELEDNKNSLSDDELPREKTLTPSVKARSSKKKRNRGLNKVQSKIVATDPIVVKDKERHTKKFLSVPASPKQELKASYDVPMAPFKTDSTLQAYWLQMERENPELYEVKGNTPFIKKIN